MILILGLVEFLIEDNDSNYTFIKVYNFQSLLPKRELLASLTKFPYTESGGVNLIISTWLDLLNRLDWMQGWADSPLTDAGKRSAVELGHKLKGIALC